MTAQQLSPEEWCRLLFEDANGWINIFAANASEKLVRWARSPEEFGRKIETELAGCDVWAGCATRRENMGARRGGDADCYEVPAAWVDIDVKGPNHKADNLPPTLAAAAELVRDFPLGPSVVVNSGGGLQAWWLFPELIDTHDLDGFFGRWAATWKELGRRHEWHVDNVFDLARVMRVPGTYNHKTNPPNPVEIRFLDARRRYSLDQLDEWTTEAPVVERPEREPYTGATRPGDVLNAFGDPALILEQRGCVYDHSDGDGTKHFRAPHHANDRTTGIVVYPDGHTTIYSETFARQVGAEIRRPYDVFGLFTTLEHAGDFREARAALKPDSGEWSDGGGFGDLIDLDDRRTLVVPDLPPLIVGTTALVSGGSFIFDETVELESRWGTGAECLWATGESLMIVGPPGVGKTTIAHQLVRALLGLDDTVLGFEVTPATRVLYLAMDRPRQIRRAMRRLFEPAERALLDERLIVHRGPMISDLAKRPEMLLELAREAEADVVFVDSLKDAAIKLSDDETGGNVNRAIQMCNAEDVDICALHHQRKGQDGSKPNKLEDVYGSTWLTAGTGSVILVWGEAGSERVELIHLKQPMDTVGPLDVEHDHIAGVSRVVSAFNCEQFLRQRGATGATATETASAWHDKKDPDKNQKKAAERRLKRLVAEGKATKSTQTVIGEEVRYHAQRTELEDL